MRLGRWARALEVATHHRAHVDTVLWYRALHLSSARRPETLEAFKKAAAAQGPLDEAGIRARKAADKAKEVAAAGSGGGRGGGRGSGAPQASLQSAARSDYGGGGGSKVPDEGLDDWCCEPACVGVTEAHAHA